MKLFINSRYWIALACAFALLSNTNEITAQSAAPVYESEHTRGPEGLEVWVISTEIPSLRRGACWSALVIAKDGHILQKKAGDPCILNWMFWSGRKEIALESGSEGSAIQCILIDTRSAQLRSTYNCTETPSTNAPTWVKALEDVP